MVQQAWSSSKHRLFCMSKNTWGNRAKVQSFLPLQKAEIQLFVLIMDAMKSRIWSIQGNPCFLNNSFLQSKFRRPEQELHCYLHLMTSDHEGWSLRCVKGTITHQEPAGVQFYMATNSRPSPPLSGWVPTVWVDSEQANCWCPSRHFKNGCFTPGKKIATANMSELPFGSLIGESAKSAQTLKNLQDMKQWWSVWCG